MHRLVNRARPILVVVLLSTLAALAPPARAAAAAESVVWSWGSNIKGELGPVGPFLDNSTIPNMLDNLRGVIAVAGGHSHSLALKSDGTVWAWGDDSFGQLGDGTIGPSLPGNPTPRQVGGLSGTVTAIAAGSAFSLALKGDGTVWAWGSGTTGQLGGGTSLPNRATPAPVTGLTGTFTAISATATRALALKSDGTVWDWGFALPTYPFDDILLPPTQVVGLSGTFTAVAAGSVFALVLKADGTVWAWGDDEFGQLGDGTVGEPSFTSTPHQVAGLAGTIKAVAAGGRHALAQRADGTVWAWGNDERGQLGDGTVGAAANATPRQVSGLSGVTMIAAGLRHSLALRGSGDVWAWGDDEIGQLGDWRQGTPLENPTPYWVVEPGGASAISAGSAFNLIVAASPTPASAQLHTLSLNLDGYGSIDFQPGGRITGPTDRQYRPGTLVTMYPTTYVGQIFAGWTYDGAPAGWGQPLTLTMSAGHALIASFSATPAFTDVSGHPDYYPVTQLAARGIIKGYGDGTFGPDDHTLRAQMAALIVRAMGWSGETPNTPFTDRCDSLAPGNCVDPELWNAVGILAAKDVARGYTNDAACGGPGTAPCYAPRDDVIQAQVISFITRAMVAQHYWQQQPVNPNLYGGVLNGTGHEQDVATYLAYTQSQSAFSFFPIEGDFATWNQASTRGWFTEALWTALNSYWSVDHLP